MDQPRIIAFATKGAGTNEEARVLELLRAHAPESFPFDHGRKIHSFRKLMRTMAQTRPDLVVMEGTGIGGGMACLLGRILHGTPYVFSSGDAVGPWVSMQDGLLGPMFGMYERLLCRWSDGFIGWTPYLAGRALTYGTPRAMTAAGWAAFDRSAESLAGARARVRSELGISPDALVFGIVGSLVWARRVNYCYGLELVRAIQRVDRPEVVVLIAGGGTGLEKLREFAGRDLGERIFLPGRIPPPQVPEFLAAMDVGSLPQSVDSVGSFRYTTKISEYVGARLPIVTGQIPLSYDLPHEWLWRLPGDSPWDERYIAALADMMQSVAREQIEQKRCAIPTQFREFDRQEQVQRATQFIGEVLERTGKARQLAGRAPRPILRHDLRGRRRLLSIAHSYVVGMNRRLVHEMVHQGRGRWNVTAVAPSYFHGAQDLRPLAFEPMLREPLRVEVIPARLSRFVHLFFYGRKLKRIMREGWDVIHAWEEPYILAGGQIARWAPDDAALIYRTAQSLHKRYPPPFNWIERHNMARANGWICSGTLVAEVLGAKRMYQQRPMRLIPLGVDLEAFQPDRAQADPVFRKLNWDKDGPPVIGYLGRFTQAKGLGLLMSVLSDLKTPWRALLVGAGPMQHQLSSWASSMGDRVRICTDVHHPEVPAYLNAMDVLVAPSQTTPQWREQFGRMLIEAFGCAVPVVGSDSGEIPHVIGEAGLIVGERDEVAWGHALRDLLNSPARRKELGERGLARAPQYSWPAIARRYLDFFTEILDARADRR